MSAFDPLRDYFERLAIRRVLQRTLGKGVNGEHFCASRWLDAIYAEPFDPRVANEAKRIRREVDALCREISASPDRRAR